MSWETTFDTWAAAYLPDVAVVCDEPMSRHTSFRIGGPAKRMAFPPVSYTHLKLPTT